MQFKKMTQTFQNGYSELPGTNRWLYSMDSYADLSEIKELKEQGEPIKGNQLTLISYPDGKSYAPYPLEYGVYYEHLLFLAGAVCFLRADFNTNRLFLIEYRPEDGPPQEIASFDLETLDLYHLRLGKYPLMLMNLKEDLQVYYPERLTLKTTARDSFILRDGDIFYFNRWVEEGLDENEAMTADYKYYDLIVQMDKNGSILSVEKGSLSEMPNGELWIF